jgi:N6-L-threonylcarbamoyladenine synthase
MATRCWRTSSLRAAKHARYGGVFPEVASRAHIAVIYAVVQQASATASTRAWRHRRHRRRAGRGCRGSLVVA